MGARDFFFFNWQFRSVIYFSSRVWIFQYCLPTGIGINSGDTWIKFLLLFFFFLVELVAIDMWEQKIKNSVSLDFLALLALFVRMLFCVLAAFLCSIITSRTRKEYQNHLVFCRNLAAKPEVQAFKFLYIC